MVGTQMLSQGHNFEKVNLVIVLGIDQQLRFEQPLMVHIDPAYPDDAWLRTEHLEEEFFRSDEEEGSDEKSREDSELERTDV